MKVRTDFVTNSSSSSFIIGKKDEENVTVESVFQIIKELYKESFGISVNDYFTEDDIWAYECETYKDYENYWTKIIEKTEDCRIHAPFTIADFLEEREINWLHFRNSYGDKIHKVDYKSDILDWYFPYIEYAYDVTNCDSCECAEWCEKEECEKSKTAIASGIPKDKACLWLLGRVCIYSECGYIPDYIVEKLYKISEHGCNHMG